MDLELIDSALQEFHSHKHAILNTGLCRGTANKPINNWYIPKLELMQSVVLSIPRVSVTIQWSLDITEHAHVDQIKDPAHGSNNNNYDLQICQQLDRLEKCRSFNLAMSLKDSGLQSDTSTSAMDNEPEEESDPSVSSQHVTDYFTRSLCLASAAPNTIPLPLCMFSVSCVTINLAYDLHICRISIDDAAKWFGLPDLRAALTDFLSYEKSHSVDSVFPIGGGPRRAAENASLPFKDIQVWFKIHLQTSDIHTRLVLPAQTLVASPPEGDWKYGRYDSVVVHTDAGAKTWPTNGLQGLSSYFISYFHDSHVSN